MFTITNILNPLTGTATTEDYKYEKGKTLAGYLGYVGECLVSCNNGVIQLPSDEIYPAHGEHYTVMPIPQGGDKQSWRILGFATMTAMSLIPGLGIGWKIAAYAGANLVNLFLQDHPESIDTSPSYSWKHLTNKVAGQGAAMPIVYGKARVRPTLKNRYIKVENDQQVLYALYSLAAHKVDERVLPTEDSIQDLSYGSEYVLGGNLMPGASFFKKTGYPNGRGTASFYNDILINGRAITAFGKDVEWETRPGLAQQTIITGFEATYSNTAADTSLYGDYPVINESEANIYKQPDKDVVSNNRHTLSHRGIIYTIQKKSSGLLSYVHWKVGETQYLYSNNAVEAGYFQIAYYQGGGLLAFKVNTHLALSDTSVDWVTPVTPLTNIHDIEVTFRLPNGLYGMDSRDKLIVAWCSMYAQYREVGAERWINFSFTFDGKTDYVDDRDNIRRGVIGRKVTKDIYITAKAVADGDAYLDPSATYEVRVLASSVAPVKVVNTAGVVYGERNSNGIRPGFTYPGEPLLGIKALASGQLSSDLDVQVDVERSQVWVWNSRLATTNKWVQVDANNHAWAVYDILVNGYYSSDTDLCHPTYPYAGNEDYAEAVYGCGVNPDNIDYESFRVWADFINDLEPTYELNIVFDTFMTAWDAILRVCQEGRGIVYPVGTKIYAMAYKDSDPVQLFTMGNIVADTFAQKYVESGERANMLEVKYWDAERNYEETVIAARTSNWDADGALNKSSNMTLYGTTSYEQAFATARFTMLNAELLNNIITFGVDVDALAAQVGDVVEVSHDVLNTGDSGRIMSVDYNPLVDSSFSNTSLTAWPQWGSPTIRQRSTAQKKYGSYSYEHQAIDTNAGSYQTHSVKPSTQYTISVWVYMTDFLANAIRIMTYDGDSYYSDYGDASLLNQWQRLSVTFTTGETQTVATMWLGGIGKCYYDGAMINPGDTAQDYTTSRTTNSITVDRTISVTAGDQVKVRHTNGDTETKTTITTGTTDTLEFSSTWDYIPEVYAVYTVGSVAGNVQRYRIIEISRTVELMRTLTLMQYDADVYVDMAEGDGDGEFVAAKIVPPPANLSEISDLLNLASNVQLEEVVTRNKVTGEYESSVVVKFDSEPPPAVRGSWEIYVRDVDASDTKWMGTYDDATEYNIHEKVELDGVTYISLENENTSTPFVR